MSRWSMCFALVLVAGSACKPRTDAAADGGAAAPSDAGSVVSARPALPAEPPPAAADLAGDVPGLKAALARDVAYQAVWSAPRAEFNAFLTLESELMATGTMAPALVASVKAKKRQDAATKLYLVFSRVGHFPDDFAKKFAAHLDATKAEPHLGTWSAFAKGGMFHDYTALATWSRPEDAAYLREHLAAKEEGAGPFAWVPPGKEVPSRPWLVDEGAALDRLALLTKRSPAEDARRAAIAADAKRPKQPRLGEEFKLGDFTYTVKTVEVVDSVGSGPLKRTAGDDARFVLVEFAIRNDSNATATVQTNEFRIVDGKGREFRPSSEANSAIALSGGKGGLIVTELQPGLKKSISTAFEVPEETAKGMFTLVIPEKGLLGTGSVRITLK